MVSQVFVGMVYFAECRLWKFEKAYFAEFHLWNVRQITP